MGQPVQTLLLHEFVSESLSTNWLGVRGKPTRDGAILIFVSIALHFNSRAYIRSGRSLPVFSFADEPPGRIHITFSFKYSLKPDAPHDALDACILHMRGLRTAGRNGHKRCWRQVAELTTDKQLISTFNRENGQGPACRNAAVFYSCCTSNCRTVWLR